MFCNTPPFCLFTGRASEAPRGPEENRDSGPQRQQIDLDAALPSPPPQKSLRGQIWGLREPFRPAGAVAVASANSQANRPPLLAGLCPCGA